MDSSRDLLAGKDWAESILDGIEKARLLLLILSPRSNRSPQVKREVERAVANGLHILTFRSENVIPSRSLEYFVSSSQWFDGWTESKGGSPKLVQALRAILGSDNSVCRSDLESPEALRQRLKAHRMAARPPQMVGVSRAMCKTLERCRALASCNDPILIMGETGVGKEVAANLIRHLSSRGDNPIFHFNCCSTPGEYGQRQLFGWAQGAFEGAARESAGLIELAADGSLFLDEFEQAEGEVLTPLTSILKTGLFTRIGGNTKLRSRARFFALTNWDLPRALAGHKVRAEFSECLSYFRQVVIPPPSGEKG